MTQRLVVYDDFLASPDRVRAHALRQSFAPQSYKGHEYNGIGSDYKFCPVASISKAVGFEAVPVLNFFRLGLAGDRTTTYIHADTGVDSATWAGVLYLSEPPSPAVGTAFWTHRELGWDALPDAEGFEAAEITPDDRFFANINEDGQGEVAWAMNGFVGMKYNRFLAYPTNLFHSRFPRDTWGTEKSEGRLIWVTFFNEA